MASSPETGTKPETSREKALRLLRVGNYIGIAVVGAIAVVEPAFIPVAAGLIALDVAQIAIYKGVGNRIKQNRMRAGPSAA